MASRTAAYAAHAIEERYRLLPYIYTVAEEASRTGMPMMRPLFMEFPEAAGGYALDLEGGNQFMWGSALLVAPAPYPEEVDRYQVILPPGDWYDYWTGARIANPAPATLTGGSGTTAEAGDDPEQMPHRVDRTPQLDRLPVFVRAGSIIARQPLVQSTSETPQGPLELAIYPGPNCQGAVYIDDGTELRLPGRLIPARPPPLPPGAGRHHDRKPRAARRHVQAVVDPPGGRNPRCLRPRRSGHAGRRGRNRSALRRGREAACASASPTNPRGAGWCCRRMGAANRPEATRPASDSLRPHGHASDR